MEVAAFLVVMEKDVHPETAEATIAAARQLRGVAGICTLYDDIGREIGLVRQVRDDVRAESLDRARATGGL